MFKSVRNVTVLAGGALALVVGVLGMASPAHATDYWIRFINEKSGLCMGVSGGVMTPGRAIIQWTCNGNDDQYWGPVSSSGGGIGVTQTYQNYQDPNYCLSVSNNSTTAGAAIVIALCDGGNSQKWTMTNVGTDGWQQIETTLTNFHSGLVLAVSAGSTSNGAAIIQWSYNGTSDTSQLWTD